MQVSSPNLGEDTCIRNIADNDPLSIRLLAT
jgi:hypothetical protein